MKVVVLAGGLSPERNVSLSSGSRVCQTLRDRGHEVAFVDMYLGADSAPETLFGAPLPADLTKVAREAPDLEKLKTQRGGDSLFGPGVLELCRMADVEDAVHLEQLVKDSGLFACKSLTVDESTLTYYELTQAEQKMYLLLAALLFAQEYADYRNQHCYFRGAMDYFTP